MAFTRKMLSAMGIEEDKQDEIINAHMEVVNSLKEERDQFKAEARKVKGLQDEIDELQKSMKSGEKSPYKVKYEAKLDELEKLQKDFDEYKKNVDAEKAEQKKASAYKKLLKDAGVSEKRINSIIKVTDLSKVNLDDEGKVKDADKLTDNIKEEWSDFIETKSTHGATTANPATNVGGGKMSKEQIMAIKDTAERQKAMLDNKELFLK